MRRGVVAGLSIGVLVILALVALTMWEDRGAPPGSEITSAPPPTSPSTVSTPPAPTQPPPPSPAEPAPPPAGGVTSSDSAKPGSPSSVSGNMPAFPWPPPRYSAFAPIVREWIADGPLPTLGSVATRLEAAFDRTGYGERTYYWVPGGFALVSRIEQIRA